MEQSTKILCPKCGSDQISAHKKGFSAGKAVVGGVITGGVGLLAGLHGKDKIEVYCLACGCKWKPADYQKIKNRHAEYQKINKKAELRKEFKKLYDYDKSKADTFAKENGLLNRHIPDIDKLNRSINNENAAATILVIGIIVFFIWMVYQCSS